VGASVGAGAVSLRKGLLQAASGGAAASEGHWSESAAAGSYEPAGSSCSGDENDDPESDAGSPPTSQLATYNSKRLCTEAMVKVRALVYIWTHNQQGCVGPRTSICKGCKRSL
jgi:hypothetical protein